MKEVIYGTNFTLEEAIEWLEFCCNEYYNYGNSPASDAEYDHVLSCVKQFYPEHAFFTKKIRNSPNKNKTKLKNPVYSLDKAKVIQDKITGAFNLDETITAVQAWLWKLYSKFGVTTFFCSPKCDGLTGIIYYEKGRAVQAVTGGDTSS